MPNVRDGLLTFDLPNNCAQFFVIFGPKVILRVSFVRIKSKKKTSLIINHLAGQSQGKMVHEGSCALTLYNLKNIITCIRNDGHNSIGTHGILVQIYGIIMIRTE